MYKTGPRTGSYSGLYVSGIYSGLYLEDAYAM